MKPHSLLCITESCFSLSISSYNHAVHSILNSFPSPARQVFYVQARRRRTSSPIMTLAKASFASRPRALADDDLWMNGQGKKQKKKYRRDRAESGTCHLCWLGVGARQRVRMIPWRTEVAKSNTGDWVQGD